MPTQFTCPSCKKVLKTSNPALAGKTIRCPQCQNPCKVPAGEEAVPSNQPRAKTEEKAAPQPQPKAKPMEKAAPQAQPPAKTEAKASPRTQPAARVEEEAVTPARRPAQPKEEDEPPQSALLAEEDEDEAPKKPQKKRKDNTRMLIGGVFLLLVVVGVAGYFVLGSLMEVDKDTTGLGPLFLLVATGLLVLGLFVTFISILATWKLYAKAGEPGWTSLVPIYNLIILARICGRSPVFALLYMIPCTMIIIPFDLAAAFGKGAGFAIGLLLFPIIFYPVLAFGSAKHVGRQPGKSSRRDEDEDEEDDLPRRRPRKDEEEEEAPLPKRRAAKYEEDEQDEEEE